jgi:hypothetical protein
VDVFVMQQIRPVAGALGAGALGKLPALIECWSLSGA